MAKAPILGNDPFQRGAAQRPATAEKHADAGGVTAAPREGPADATEARVARKSPAPRKPQSSRKAAGATKASASAKPATAPKSTPVEKTAPAAAARARAAGETRDAAKASAPSASSATPDAAATGPRRTGKKAAGKAPAPKERRPSPSAPAQRPEAVAAPPVSASSKGDAAREAEPAELRSGSATRVFEGELVDEIPSKRSLVPNVPFQAAPSPQERTGGRLGSWGERLWHAVEAAVERTGTMPLLQRISEELAVHPVMQRLNAVTAQAARVASPAVDWASRMLPPAMGFARAAVEAVASGEATRTLTGAAIDAGVVVGKLSRRVEPLSVEVDPFGEDPSTVARFEPIFDFLHDRYFRIEVLGAQRVPKGASLLACNHSGALPLDGPMLRTVLRRECGRQDARWLVEDAVFHAPFMGVSLNRLGAVRACPENAERLLAMGLPLAVFPEGLLGLSKGFGRRYQLQRFGRGGFVKLAMRTGVPIVPVAIVGAEESFPLLARISLRRASVPYLPLTPLLPLPMKWTVSFLEPVDLSAFGPKGAEDLALVSRLSAEIRDSIQRELDRIVGQRRLRFQARA